ncbi:MAG TPA: HAD-IG family 5'-nucleotidase [Candidatus Ozemobacteraceae bacterium]|nr:HAD-IG family 5'-nucleotidase [Candidatus Ozemobacteraceae bacterium]
MSTSQRISAEQRIFVNRTLNMNHIKLVGFDMDYTLATYNVPAFEETAYRIVLDKLVKDMGYPPELAEMKFDPEFVIRGLVIDVELGNFLKVNRYGYVKKASHGTKFLTIEEQKKIYPSTGIDLTDPRYYIIHTLFSLAEGCLFAQLVDLVDAKQMPMNLKKAFNDIRRALDDAHQEGNLKGQVINDPDRYFIRDRRMVTALQRLKAAGKKIAMITNSDFEYSQKVMNHCFGPYLEGKSWQELFDIIIVCANKPAFFQQHQKFLRVDPASGLLANFHAPIRWGGIYQSGNARTFEKDLGLSPSEIFYLGDHIWGDVVTLKEAIGWRTGLIVQELAEEVPALERHAETHCEIVSAMEKKEELEDQLFDIKESLRGIPSEKRPPEAEKRREGLREQIAKIDEQITKLINDEQRDFNKYWGEVMRAGNEESRFATLVERYACVYMASISNLASYSPFKYFRPPRRYMAHDPLHLLESGTDTE